MDYESAITLPITLRGRDKLRQRLIDAGWKCTPQNCESGTFDNFTRQDGMPAGIALETVVHQHGRRSATVCWLHIDPVEIAAVSRVR